MGNQDGIKPQTIVTDPEQLTTLVPGRYSIVDSMLFCEPAILDNAGLTFSTFGPGKFICQFPMNSTVILDSTRVTYGNVFKLDEFVSHHRPMYQADLAEEFQAQFPQTFFDQNIDPSMRFILYDTNTALGADADGRIKYTTKAAGTLYKVNIYKTF